jgi:hypothetical protein
MRAKAIFCFNSWLYNVLMASNHGAPSAKRTPSRRNIMGMFDDIVNSIGDSIVREVDSWGSGPICRTIDSVTDNFVVPAIQTVVDNPGKALLITGAAVVTGGAAFVAAPTIAGAIGTTGLLGSASTGTAISTLTGAALESAALASVGGGALAVGGGGMVAGAQVLGASGAVIGAAASSAAVAATS